MTFWLRLGIAVHRPPIIGLMTRIGIEIPSRVTDYWILLMIVCGFGASGKLYGDVFLEYSAASLLQTRYLRIELDVFYCRVLFQCRGKAED